MSEPFTLYDVESGEVFQCASPTWAAQQVAAGRYSYTPPEEEAQIDDLTAIDGVGQARAGALQDAGYGSYAALATADPDEVADALGVAPEQVKTWQGHAAGLLPG